LISEKGGIEEKIVQSWKRGRKKRPLTYNSFIVKSLHQTIPLMIRGYP